MNICVQRTFKAMIRRDILNMANMNKILRFRERQRMEFSIKEREMQACFIFTFTFLGCEIKHNAHVI